MPPPVTVILADLDDVPVFALYVIASVPLFEPEPGDTVHQDVALLEAVHDTLDVTPTDTELAVDPTV